LELRASRKVFRLKLFRIERFMDNKPVFTSLILLGVICLLSGCAVLRSAAQILTIAGIEQDVAESRTGQREEAGTNVNSPPASANPNTTAGPLLELLRYIPDDPAHRQFLSFGDAAAWHSAWAMPCVENFEAVQNLPSPRREQWLFALPLQTLPPPVLGTQYLAVEEMGDMYGFSMYDAERYLDAGQPPDNFAVIDISADQEQIVATLRAFGYLCTADDQGYLCSIGEDYEADLQSPSLVGRLGGLNRIAVLDGRLIIGKATSLITNALASDAGDKRSLADDPFYQAASHALAHPTMVENGALVGVLLNGMPFFEDPLVMLDRGNSAIQEQLARYAAEPLPSFALAAFATYRGSGASYLTVALVFPIGVNAEAAAATLAERLQTYVSPVTGVPLDGDWAYEDASAVEAAGLPVALVTMRVDDPEEEADESWHIFSWANLIFRRDVHFLMNGPPDVERE
jgi:hypothetical protein